MPPGICVDLTSTCAALHGPCGAGAVLMTTLLEPLQYSTTYFWRYVLYWADISLTGAGITAVAADGLFRTHDPLPKMGLFQYSYWVRSSTEPSGTLATCAAPPRPDGVPNE